MSFRMNNRSIVRKLWTCRSPLCYRTISTHLVSFLSRPRFAINNKSTSRVPPTASYALGVVSSILSSLSVRLREWFTLFRRSRWITTSYLRQGRLSSLTGIFSSGFPNHAAQLEDRGESWFVNFLGNLL